MKHSKIHQKTILWISGIALLSVMASPQAAMAFQHDPTIARTFLGNLEIRLVNRQNEYNYREQQRHHYRNMDRYNRQRPYVSNNSRRYRRPRYGNTYQEPERCRPFYSRRHRRHRENSNYRPRRQWREYYSW